MKKINFIKYKAFWLSISGAMVVISIVFLSMWGLKFGLDFTGGSLLEVKFANSQPNVAQVQSALAGQDLGSLIIQPSEGNNIILRFSNVDEDTHQAVLEKLGSLSADHGNFEELKFDSIGPSIGQELRSKAFWIFILVLAIIIIYISFTFQKVSKPVASWKYGLISVIALFHDILITIGIFSLLGHFYGIEVNSAFIVALLTVLGYSVNDTIVVFDRVRENLPKSELDFEGTVNSSLNQTVMRSINTTLSTLLALVAVFIFGGSSIRDFVLTLMVGIFCGAYSSIFVASPLLAYFQKWQKK
jgi:preprotein translocase subunit SecF